MMMTFLLSFVMWIGFGESVDVLFNSSALWGVLPAGDAPRRTSGA
jgi:hypothetical protein